MTTEPGVTVGWLCTPGALELEKACVRGCEHRLVKGSERGLELSADSEARVDWCTNRKLVRAVSVWIVFFV